MRPAPAILALVASGSVGGAQARPATPVDTVVAETVSESFVRSVRVSGATRAGVMSGDPAALVTPGHLAVLVPATAGAGTICIRVLSADGQYEARIRHVLAPTGGTRAGPVLSFRTAYAEQLKGMRASDLAIEAMLEPTGAGCEGRDGRVLVASWQPEVSDRDFWVLVNSGQMRTHIAATVDGSPREFPCEPATTGRRVAFDLRCRVTLGPDERPTRIQIVRRRLGSVLPSITIPMSWP